MESLYFRFRQAIGDLVYLATDDARKHECDVTPFVQVTVEILEHGFNSKSTIFNRGRNVWDFIKSVLKEPAIIETVENLTELDPNLRVAVFVKMNLFQQTLTENLNLLYFDDDILDEWYLATAIMRNPEMKTAIIEITKSLQKLELNVDIQQATKPDLLPKMPDIKYFGSYLSPTAVKAGISQTFETIGKVQSQIVDTAKIGIDRFKSNDSALGPAEMVNKVEFDALQAQLNAEISEKIKTKLSRDRIKRAYGEEIARLESILKYHNIEFDSILNSLMNQE